MKGAAEGGERGLVLAVEGRSAVVLTPAGEFRRVPLDRPDRRVGEEMVIPERGGWQWLPALGGLAAAAALLLAVALTGLRGGPSPERSAPSLLVEAYVSVDINPSLELGVAGDASVVEGRPLNEDGRRLLAAVPHRGRPLAEVLPSLVREAARVGYLAPGRAGEVVIAAAPARPGDVAAPVVAAVRRGEAAARAYLRDEGVRASVYAVRVGGAELHREAGSVGLSVGKYLVMKELEDAGLTLAPEELKRAGLGRVLRERGLEPGEFLRRAARDARREIELIDDEEADGEESAGAVVRPGRGGEADGPGLRDGEDRKERGDGEGRPFEVRPEGRGLPGFLAPGRGRKDDQAPPAREGMSGERLRGGDERKTGRDKDGREGERRDERGEDGAPDGRGEDVPLAVPPDREVRSGVYGSGWAPTGEGGAWVGGDATTSGDREGVKKTEGDREHKDKKEGDREGGDGGEGD